MCTLKTSRLNVAAAAVLTLIASGVNAQQIFDASGRTAVPADRNVIMFTAIGGGGGGGGADDGWPRSAAGTGGSGGNAASLEGVIQVYPDQTVEVVVGQGGGLGGSNIVHGRPGSEGGAGGSGSGEGGKGGATEAAQNPQSYNGVGGGGGGATSLSVNSNWVRAGGGGGGGGGGNAIGGLNGQQIAIDWAFTDLCRMAGNGAQGVRVPDTGDGGTAGGNGGSYDSAAPSTTVPAKSGEDRVTAAEGGYIGGSCHYGFVEPGTANQAQGTPGNAPLAPPGVGGLGARIDPSNYGIIPGSNSGKGRVTISFERDENRIPTVTAVTPGSAIGTVTIQTPQTLPPGMQVQNYAVTCTPKDAASGATPVTRDTTGAQTSIDMPLQNDVTYTCTVQAQLIGTTDTALTLKTLVSANSGDVTPKAPATGPVTPGSATAVPTLSEWALILLSALLGGLAALRMRQSRVGARHGSR